MKKTVVGIVAAIFLVCVAASSSFAGVGPGSLEFDEIYMTDGDGNTNVRTSFGWDETPWLYLQLPVTAPNVTGTWWESSDSDYYFVGSSPTFSSSLWVSLDEGQDAIGNDVAWDDIKTEGLWNVNAAGYYFDAKVVTGSTGFTVTPEPMSSILFILGAVFLAFFKFKHRIRTPNLVCS